MFVGVQRLVLHIPAARSLKDRRRVVRSFRDRAAGKFRLSVAEVGDLNQPSVAVIAMAVVSNEAAFCDEIMEKVATMASQLPDALLADRATEIVSFGEGGSGIRGGIEQRMNDAMLQIAGEDMLDQCRGDADNDGDKNG